MAKGKEKFTRYSMRENMLKKVLFRIDYDGVTNIEKWIDQMKSDDLITQRFHSYRRVMLNNATFSISRMEEVAEQRSLPLSEFRSQPLHRFFESDFPGRQDKVAMEIASLFMTFEIDCNHYSTIDDYFNYINTYIERFLAFDRYIKVKRIGIRKIGGESFDKKKDIPETFEGKFFSEHTIDGVRTRMIEREYNDKFFKTIEVEKNVNKSVKVNYSTLCRLYEEKKEYQTVLDIDGYVDEFIINLDKLVFPRDFKSTLNLINDYLFVLYKKSVTRKYLLNNGEEEQ